MDKTYDDPARSRKRRFWKREHLRIATWNVTSLTNKDQEIIIELKNHNIDICALSETKKKDKGNLQLAEYILICSGRSKDDRAASGVSLLVHDKYQKNIIDICYVSDRLLLTTIELTKTTKMHIKSVYAPDTTKPQEERDSFYDELQNTLDRIPKAEEIMILGDLNARENSRRKYVLLVISLAGIKVCSPDGKIVHMAHALRRISFATCDPEQSLFSFLAREPKGHSNQQFCHSFISHYPEQAEELNSIVGNAFRMAYAAQLQKQPSFQDVIASQLDQTQTNKVLWTKELSVTLKKDKSSHQQNNHQTSEMDVELTSTDASTLRLTPPSTIPGLKPAHKYNVLGPSEKAPSQQSTPSSDESNSPTEMNSYKRMAEKPPLIKRIAMGLTGNHHDNDDDSCPLVSDGNSTPGSPTNRPLSGGYVNESSNDADSKNLNKTNNAIDNNLKNDIVENINANLTKHIEIDHSRLLQSSPASIEHEFKTKRISQISSSSSGSCPQNTTEATILGMTPSPPPLPERTDSLNNKEEGELRTAPWFQAGIPREIALEILGQEPVGAFMVRESTSKPGCFALSLRVPRSFQPTGIAHYLIVRTNKGYKIKGFTKEFGTLTSLITHHSVMPELLPCPLSLSRYNPSFVRSDSKRDFADIDLDPDYNTLADFRKMMADLNI